MPCSAVLLTVSLVLSAPPPAANSNRSPETSARASANTPAAKKPQYLKISRGLISAIDDVAVPAQEAGVIREINVKENGSDPITQGTLLAQIDDRDAQAKKKVAEIEVEIAAEQSSSDVKVRIAEKTAAVADAEHKKSLEINAKSPGAVPETEVRRQKLTTERQLLEAESAAMELRVAALTEKAKAAAVEQVDNDLRKRRIESPVDGVVDRILKRVGEWVTPGEQVFRIVRMDHLRVEGFVNYEEVSPLEVIGQPVTVEVRLTHGGKTSIEKVTGTIEFVSPVIEGGEYRIWTEVENRRIRGQWLLHPGANADMTIELKHFDP